MAELSFLIYSPVLLPCYLSVQGTEGAQASEELERLQEITLHLYLDGLQTQSFASHPSSRMLTW